MLDVGRHWPGHVQEEVGVDDDEVEVGDEGGRGGEGGEAGTDEAVGQEGLGKQVLQF